MTLNPMTIISLNVNGLNSPIKRHRVAKWVKKMNPTFCCLQETHLNSQNKHRLKIKGCRKVIQANNTLKRAGVAILISDDTNFILRKVVRDKDGHYVLIKGYVQQEEIRLLNIYAPNERPANYLIQLLINLKEEINDNTIIMGDLNKALSTLDRSTRLKPNKTY